MFIWTYWEPAGPSWTCARRDPRLGLTPGELRPTGQAGGPRSDSLRRPYPDCGRRQERADRWCRRASPIRCRQQKCGLAVWPALPMASSWTATERREGRLPLRDLCTQCRRNAALLGDLEIGFWSGVFLYSALDMIIRSIPPEGGSTKERHLGRTERWRI